MKAGSGAVGKQAVNLVNSRPQETQQIGSQDTPLSADNVIHRTDEEQLVVSLNQQRRDIWSVKKQFERAIKKVLLSKPPERAESENRTIKNYRQMETGKNASVNKFCRFEYIIPIKTGAVFPVVRCVL